MPFDKVKAAKLAKAHKPRGWQIHYVAALSARAISTERRKLLLVPKPTNAFRLAVYLHECSHILHRYGELEATEWAFTQMRQAGFAVPKPVRRFFAGVLAHRLAGLKIPAWVRNAKPIIKRKIHEERIEAEIRRVFQEVGLDYEAEASSWYIQETQRIWALQQ